LLVKKLIAAQTAESRDMKKAQEKLLEEYLWTLTKWIGDDIHGLQGLPPDWMQRRVEDLANIFRPEK